MYDAAAYATFRAPYPVELFDEIAAAFDLKAGDLVVDVGCGTGQLAVPLAQKGMRVLGVDPHERMLTFARIAAQKAGAHVDFVRARAEELVALVPERARLATFGCSLHWMDRDRVLAACERVLDDDGGVCVVDARARPAPWHALFDAVIARFRKVYPRPTPGTHEEALARSAFTRVKAWRTVLLLERTPDEIAGLGLSMSGCSQEDLGMQQQDALRRALREELMAAFPGSRFPERHEVTALFARRPR